MLISSIHNSKVQEAKRLRLRKYRDRTGLVLVEGVKHVCDALSAGGRLCRLFVSDQAFGSRVVDSIVGEASSSGADVLVCSPEVVASLSSVETSQGVVATFLSPWVSVERVVNRTVKGSMAFLLDRLQDPGNVGTIIRTASACGASGVIVSPGTVDPLNDKVVRSTASALFSVGVARAQSLLDIVRNLRQLGVRVVATDARSERFYFDECLTGSIALIVGNEGDGISSELLDLADVSVSIPMPGRVESLNAAVATSIVAYEAVRQRMRPQSPCSR